MRIVPLVLLALTAAALPARAGPDTTAEYDALPWRDTFDDFVPTLDDMRLAVLADTDAGWDLIQALALADQVRVVRTGLRLPTGAAGAACAQMADANWFDLAEHRVAADHIVTDFVAPSFIPRERSLWPLIEHFSGSDVRGILERLRGVPGRRLSESSVSVLHKVMRPDALPVAAALVESFGDDVPRGLDEQVWLHAWHTDRHREDVARAVLGAQRADALPDAAPGLPPLLADCLRSLYLEREHDDSERHAYGRWALRWLRDAVPDETDAPLLVALVVERRQPVAAWSLRHLSDIASWEALHETLDAIEAYDDLGALGSAAVAALIHRGANGLTWILADATPTSASAVAFLLETDPDAAVEALTAALFDPDFALDEHGDPLWSGPLSALNGALDRERLRFGLTWTDSVLTELEERALASDADAGTLLGLADTVPACRTKRLLDEALRRAGATTFQEAWQLATFEVAAPAALRVRLRDWAISTHADSREFALSALLAMGDPEAGPRLVAALEDGSLEPSDEGLSALVRSAGPEVRAFLRRRADDPDVYASWDALTALAVLDGLPPGVELTPSVYEHAEDSTTGPSPDDITAVRDLVLAGRPIEAFVRLLEATRDEPRAGAGDVDDPRVTAYLQRLREQRHLELYPWATAELAIQGDLEARAETWQALRTGNYRWCDNLDWRQRTMGHDLGTLPLWAAFFESSCCQVPTARVVFDNLLDVKPPTEDGFWTTERDWAQQWLREHDVGFAWSHIAQGFRPLPR